MISRYKKMILFPMFILVLCGCWDQKMLKNTVLLSATALQIASDDEILVTTAIQSYTSKEQQPINKTYFVTAFSSRNAKIKLNQQMSGTVMSAKNKVFLIQDELAGKGLLQIADVLYRNPENPLNGKFAVVEENPQEILNLQKVGEELIGEYLAGLIKTSETSSVIPVETIQSMCTILFDEGKGLVLPYIIMDKKNGTADVAGTALFHKDKFSGVTMNLEQSKTLLLMADRKEKLMDMSHKINYNGKKLTVAYDVADSKAKMKIMKDLNHKVKVSIPMNVQIEINEFPHDHLYEKKVLKKVNKEVTKYLQRQSEETAAKLQESNCDFFGIGRELIAYHPAIWKKVKWEEDYPNILIEPKVSVEIVHHGIIN
ncbi:Ger(x)C family spore germination protein [Metabacillus dongyingensis]|uniref:Ger(x)C family spore germination protein n=1 Tax=Metabacillus dongyingensis TaxID=2874282 RepID=UPI003B8B7BEE